MRNHISALALLLSMAITAGAQTKPAANSAPKAEAPPAPKIKVGDMAPEFKLLDQNGNVVSLSDFKGKKNVALAFYVFAFTGG